MASQPRVRRGAPTPSNDPAAAPQRYAIVIGGTHVRTICGDAAATTFRRWSISPDVVMRGDMATGFFWEWPDPVRTRIEIVPEHDQSSYSYVRSPAAPADSAVGRPSHGAVAT